MADRLDLMRAAALAAFERLEDVGITDPRTGRSLYAPLGETLMWLSALADATGVKKQPLFLGLIYARNCVVHGLDVVAIVQEAVQPPWSRSPLKGDGLRFTGTATARIWGFVEDPEPDQSGWLEHRNAYKEHVANYAMHALLARALDELGVDISGSFHRRLNARVPCRCGRCGGRCGDSGTLETAQTLVDPAG